MQYDYIKYTEKKSIMKYNVDAKIVMNVLINLNTLVDKIAETGDKELIAAYAAIAWVLEKFGIIEEVPDETDNH